MNLNAKNLVFLDTETTGIGADDTLCQLAYKYDNEVFCELYNPGKKIPPEASAVTHISNKMVADKPSFRESADYTKIKNLLENPETIFVAHNAKFDLMMIKKEDIEPANVICTLRVARYLDPEHKIPQHKLQFLRYYLEIEIEAQAHDALGDVLVLEQLFPRLLAKMIEMEGDEEKAIAKMIDVSSRPSMMYSFSFGKHLGRTVADVAKIDSGYLEWLLAEKEKNDKDDEDWIYTLKYYLGKLV